MSTAFQAGATDVRVSILARHATTGAKLTGLAFNTAGLLAYYAREGAAPVAITLATQTVNGAHTDGGFVEKDATNQPGEYRLDLPDAALAAGVTHVIVTLTGANSMARLWIDLTADNPRAAAPTTAEIALEVASEVDLAATLATHTGDTTLTVATDAGNDAAEFEVEEDVGADVRTGFLRLTSGALTGESRLVRHTGTTVTVLAHEDMPAGLLAYSATPADGVTGLFRPI